MYDTLNYESITSIKNKLTAAAAEKENTLLILNDVGASLKKKKYKKNCVK